MSIINTFRKNTTVPCAECGAVVDRGLAFRADGQYFCCVLHALEAAQVDRSFATA